MLTSDKRTPHLEDTDLMPFGRFKGSPLQDVPASYLKWLYLEMKPRYNQAKIDTHTPPEIINNIKLFNYLHNNLEAIELELKGD